MTREEHEGQQPLGSTRRYERIAPLVAFVLLTGVRIGEALTLKWANIDLTTLDLNGEPKGEIHVESSDTKTGHARVITLEVSPSVRALLASTEKTGPYVFGGERALSKSTVEPARRRLIGKKFGAPTNLSWQILRSTCATYQTNAPSLFGAAAAWMSAKRLGHSVQVSEKHYAGLVEVPRAARTLEGAMQIEALMQSIVEEAGARRGIVSTGTLRAANDELRETSVA